MSDAAFIIVAVPTPVDDNNEPVLVHLESASRMVGNAFRARTEGLPPPVIVYESTTFPGCTEEVCGPAIAESSRLQAGVDFRLGYSPERTNFGDREHTLATVVKVVSGQDEATATLIEALYRKIATGGTHRAPDIRTAEAAKVIENIQRDLNIALINELAMLFDRIGLDTSKVLDAAATKWNFSRYSPGLVGGHCIPVDPYYLTSLAEKSGFHSSLILAGRKTNENMTGFVADKLETLLADQNKNLANSRVLVMGVAFKPNVSDIRNSKAIVLARLLSDSGAQVETYDPHVDPATLERVGLKAVSDRAAMEAVYDALVVATGHTEFVETGADEYGKWLTTPGVIVDVPGSLCPGLDDTSGGCTHVYWRP